MHFEFATANRIIFGSGSVEKVGEYAADLGSRALVVVGRDASRSDTLVKFLVHSSIAAVRHSVIGEPTVEHVIQGTQTARDAGCDLVIAMGGGSAIDTGKAIAAMLPNEGPILNYLEVIGKGAPLEREPLPTIAIPTTAGTGSEVTRNAVLTSRDHRVKVSMRSPMMLPRVAVVDPLLTLGLPPPVTAATGMDALAQLIEAYVSTRANPIVDSLARDGIAQCAQALKRAYIDGLDRTAREKMALASLLGGLSLANAGLGAVHGIAGPLGGMVAIPHGSACGKLLPLVMRANIRNLDSQDPDSNFLCRYREIATILTGKKNAAAMDGAAWVSALGEELNIPGLGRFGVTRELFPELIKAAKRASSMQANPALLDDQELNTICEKAL
jgi:alcohol dehydrogenase class IV